MAFRTCFLDALQRAGDEYDLIAACYLELLTYIDDYDMSFVSAQVSGLSSEAGFRAAMTELRKSILLSLQQGECAGEAVLGHSCAGFIGALRKVDSPDEDLPVFIFLMIHILDGYVNSSLAELGEYPSLKYQSGPLNCGDSLEQCLVYPQAPNSLMRESRRKFRHPLKSDRIGSLMSNILLMKRDKLLGKGQEPPRIVHITPSKDCGKAILGKKSIKISSIPYIGFRTIRFHVLGKPEPCKADNEINGPFYVENPPEEEEANVGRILALLKTAIQDGAHIIIFPEFIMSEKMKEAVQAYLRTISCAERHELLLVLAGTTFHVEGKNTFHNVLHLLGADGEELGRCYKFSPFRIARARSAQDDGRGQSDFFRCCELLSIPGKECTLIDIDGIGRILPLICRDVTDGSRLRLLSDAFDPDLVLVPAWSRSVSTFQIQMEEQANTHLIGSLLCNCCNAVAGKNETGAKTGLLCLLQKADSIRKAVISLICNRRSAIADKNEAGTKTGLLCLPHKAGSSMKAVSSFIERPAKCVDTCQAHGGCVVPITLDFSQAQPVGHIEAHRFPNHQKSLVSSESCGTIIR